MKLFAASLTLLALVGCNKSQPTTANSSVTDIKPIPHAVAVTPVQPLQPIQPVVNDNPVIATSTTPTAVTPNATVATNTPATPAITGNTYVVKKGDTLFSIARARYGDQSAIKKIKEANPGINPDQIKAGQKINLPN